MKNSAQEKTNKYADCAHYELHPFVDSTCLKDTTIIYKKKKKSSMGVVSKFNGNQNKYRRTIISADLIMDKTTKRER